jgi:hypothetical protein
VFTRYEKNLKITGQTGTGKDSGRASFSPPKTNAGVFGSDMRSRIDMASNTQERLHWTVRLPPRPEPDSDAGRWLKTVKHVQSQKDVLGCASPHPLKPEVVRCVRGFAAWKFDGSVPEASSYADRSKTPVQVGPGGTGY